jgi:tetratricopeptide (TPR) repeat protein
MRAHASRPTRSGRASVIAAFLLWITVAGLGNADEGGRRYAALSLIGETLTLVSYVGSTGSQLSPNRHESVSVASRLFDTAALNAVQLSLKDLDVRTPVATFFGTSPALFTEQANLFDGRRVVLSQDLLAAMKKEGATHLLIITRHRGHADVRLGSGNTGSGMLEGVGYYIDREVRNFTYSSGGEARGLIAPYVYLRISLVDLATSVIERERFVTWSVAASAASFASSSGSSGDPREVFAGKHLPVLVDALTREIRGAMPSLLGEDACGADAGAGDDRIAACTRVIASGQLKNEALARAFKTRAVDWRSKRDPDRAIADLNEAIRLDPQYALAYFDRANAWYAKRDFDHAIADYSEAIRLNPQYAIAYNNRGNAWSAKRDEDHAIADYSEAIRLNPRYANAYTNRASAWRAKRDLDRALADHEAAIRIDPDNASRLNNFAWFLAVVSEDKAKGGTRAVEYARRACELTGWKEANNLDTLAAAYAAAGDFREAIRWQEKALEDANFAKSSDARARARLELYRAGKPYRE